jgi:hypothetical protein
MKQKPHSFFVISFSFSPRIYFSSAELKTHIKTSRMIFRGHKFAPKFERFVVRLGDVKAECGEGRKGGWRGGIKW